MLPQAMQFAVPGALLMAATSVYGRVAAANEMTAIKALGISPLVLIWPAIVLAAALSLMSVVLNDVAVSWGRGGVDRVILESLEEIVYGRLRTVRSFSNQRLEVNVRHVAGRQLVHPIIRFRSAGGRPPSLVKADAAELEADPATNAITIRLFNAEADVNGCSVTHPGEFVRSFPLDELTGRGVASRTPSEYALSEIGPAKAAQIASIAELKHAMAAEMAAALLLGNFAEFAPDPWRVREHELLLSERTLSRLKTEPHRRWANGFSCLGFVLIGAPMAVRRRHGEFWGSFFICFLPILLIYYPMLAMVDQAKDGAVPPQAVWLGNIVLAALGAWLLRRVLRF
jgi:lipopolysaccharide export system permease protein